VKKNLSPNVKVKGVRKSNAPKPKQNMKTLKKVDSIFLSINYFITYVILIMSIKDIIIKLKQQILIK